MGKKLTLLPRLITTLLVLKRRKAQTLLFCDGAALFDSQVITTRDTFFSDLVEIYERDARTQRSYS
jgi:hypothetical protein